MRSPGSEPGRPTASAGTARWWTRRLPWPGHRPGTGRHDRLIPWSTTSSWRAIPTRTRGCRTWSGSRWGRPASSSRRRSRGRGRARCTAIGPRSGRPTRKSWNGTPSASCTRRGPAIDLVLARARENRSQLVITRARGREVIFWQSPRTAKQARPGVHLPTARAHGQVLDILVDTGEKYPYAFAAQQATTRRQRLAAGDYAVELDGDVVAAVERKTLEDLAGSLLSGKLRYALADLAALPRAAVVVEDRYSRLFKLPHRPGARVAEAWPRRRRGSRRAVVFCETRPLAQEWTYRWLGACLAEVSAARATAGGGDIVHARHARSARAADPGGDARLGACPGHRDQRPRSHPGRRPPPFRPVGAVAGDDHRLSRSPGEARHGRRQGRYRTRGRAGASPGVVAGQPPPDLAVHRHGRLERAEHADQSAGHAQQQKVPRRDGQPALGARRRAERVGGPSGLLLEPCRG